MATCDEAEPEPGAKVSTEAVLANVNEPPKLKAPPTGAIVPLALRLTEPAA